MDFLEISEIFTKNCISVIDLAEFKSKCEKLSKSMNLKLESIEKYHQLNLMRIDTINQIIDVLENNIKRPNLSERNKQKMLSSLNDLEKNITAQFLIKGK